MTQEIIRYILEQASGVVIALVLIVRALKASWTA